VTEEPIELDFTLACSPQHAFDVWTQRTTTWWPPEHTMSRDPAVSVTFEPRAGGRIFERTPDGVEHDWGEIVTWDPPERLVYMWHIATERGNATEVAITFVPEGERTRVVVRHDGWDHLGAFGPEWRQANRLGWGGTLPAYRRAIAATA
jgi:uncharacterized protein YndB with AHSA1/START domain